MDPKILRTLPPRTKYWENKPSAPSHFRRKFSGITVIVDTRGFNVTATPILDGVALASQTISSNDPLAIFINMDAVVGKDLWVKLQATSTAYESFRVYEAQARVIEDYPIQVQGLLPATNLGTAQEKEIYGVDMKICTLGATRTFTPYFDGVQDLTRQFTLQSPADEPITEQVVWTSPVICEDFQLHVDGPVEIWNL